MGNKLITGHTNGEIHIWNGATLKFDTVNSVHDEGIKVMKWIKDYEWLITADKKGYIFYWSPTLKAIHNIHAHTTQIRDLDFSPPSAKFVSCCDDRVVKLYDFITCTEELKFDGHRSDVKCCQWHPYESCVVSAGRDSEIKFWEPKSGKEIHTIQSHYNAINKLKWNKNGNWFLSGSKDTSIKIYDVRVMKEFHTFQAHKGEINSIEWHPDCEELFVSGCNDGQIIFWQANDDIIHEIPDAHSNSIWNLAWHPMGNSLASAGNDAYLHLWSRLKPGEELKNVTEVKDKMETEAQMYGTSKSGNMTYVKHPIVEKRIKK